MLTSGLAREKAAWMVGALVMLVLGLTLPGTPLAQTQTTTTVDVRKFEVIAVDGNHLVLRDERGTNEYTVPSDFLFTVDGKKMSVSDLKAGMKGTATVTTTTTIKPVVVTEIRRGVVLMVGQGSVTVRDETDGLRKRFTQDQLNDRGLQIFKDGRAIGVSQLNKGDQITATVISRHPPVVVTEQDVQATLASPSPSPRRRRPRPSRSRLPPRPTRPPPRRHRPPSLCNPPHRWRLLKWWLQLCPFPRGRIVRVGNAVVPADRPGRRGDAVLCRAPAQGRRNQPN
jgi:hypothetical protein